MGRRIFITGPTCVLGEEFINRYASKFEFIRLGKKESNYWELGQPIPPSRKDDVLIHLAHDRNKEIKEIIDDNLKIIESFKGQITFISSTSAHANTKSNYGQSKKKLENLFIEAGAQVIKAGLITHDENFLRNDVYSKLIQIKNASRIIIIPFYNRIKLHCVDVGALCRLIDYQVDNFSQERIAGFDQNPKTIKQIFEGISPNLKRRYFYMPDMKLSLLLYLASKKFRLPNIIDSYLSLSQLISLNEIDQLQVSQYDI
jgi:hypothetical protein